MCVSTKEKVVKTHVLEKWIDELSREEGRGTGFCFSKSKSCLGNSGKGSV